MSAPQRSRPRVCVTGGAGFIGSHLADRLLAEGAAVLVVDDLSSGRLANVAAEAEVARLDIANDELESLLRRWRPAAVYHLAAQSSVPASARDPLRDLAVNVVGTHRLAEAARSAGASRLVFVSSGGAVYGETVEPATEATPAAPASYYGVHKLAAEGHVRLAGLAWAILRPSNVYGPRQGGALEGAVVAAFLEQAAGSGTLRIHGDGSQTRDFVHVDDVVAALLLTGDPATGNGTWNVAADRSVSIRDLADEVERAAGRPLGRSFGPRREGDVAVSRISAGALRRLGWRPAVDLRAGLTALVGEAAGGTSEPSGRPV